MPRRDNIPDNSETTALEPCARPEHAICHILGVIALDDLCQLQGYCAQGGSPANEVGRISNLTGQGRLRHRAPPLVHGEGHRKRFEHQPRFDDLIRQRARGDVIRRRINHAPRQKALRRNGELGLLFDHALDLEENIFRLIVGEVSRLAPVDRAGEGRAVARGKHMLCPSELRPIVICHPDIPKRFLQGGVDIRQRAAGVSSHQASHLHLEGDTPRISPTGKALNTHRGAGQALRYLSWGNLALEPCKRDAGVCQRIGHPSGA